MKKYALIGGASILLFVLTAAGSYYWQQHLDGEGGGTHAGTKAAPEAARDTEPKVPARAAARPTYVPESDQISALSADVQKGIAANKRREVELEERAKQLELLQEDLRGERTALDALRKQVEKEMEELRKQVAVIEKAQAGLNSDRASAGKELDATQKQLLAIQREEEPNLKKIGDWWNSMEPAAVAQLVQKMCDSGKMDMTVKILSYMQPRQAAPVIAELTEIDSLLATQLMEKVRNTRTSQPEPAPKSARPTAPR